MSNRVIDVVEQNIDVDIRIGKLVDSSLVARKLAASERVVCAAPAYLKGRTPVAHPTDLAGHNCLTYRINVGRTVWRFLDGAGTLQEIPVQGSLTTDNGYALLNATLAGVGVALMPDWSVRDHLASGRLVRLLPGYRVSHIEFDNGIYAVFQKSRHMSAKVRAFIDYLAAAFEQRLA
jgi:DNA-binding transcriptional LysR family regulator